MALKQIHEPEEWPPVSIRSPVLQGRLDLPSSVIRCCPQGLGIPAELFAGRIEVQLSVPVGIDLGEFVKARGESRHLRKPKICAGSTCRVPSSLQDGRQEPRDLSSNRTPNVGRVT